MSKASGFATTVAVALSWLTVSCAGVVFFKPPTAGPAVLASATAPGSGQVAAASMTSGGGFFLVSLLGFAGLGVAMFMLQGKAPETSVATGEKV